MSFRLKFDRMFQKPEYGFYFAPESGCLRYGDNRRVGLGITHSVPGKIIICGNGLHGSKEFLHACHYSPGHKAYFVRFDGSIVHSDLGDKLVARHRTYIKEIEYERHILDFCKLYIDKYYFKYIPDAHKIMFRDVLDREESIIFHEKYYHELYNLPRNGFSLLCQLDSIQHLSKTITSPLRIKPCIYHLHQCIYDVVTLQELILEFEEYLWKKECLNDYIDS